MIFKNSLVLAIFSGLSLVMAIIRDRLLATHVGIGPTLDVYNAAFRLPDLLYGALLAFVTAGTVVPFLTKENIHGDIVDPRHKLYSLTLFFGGALCILVFILGLSLPLYAHLIVPGFTDAQLREFIFGTRLLLIQPFFLGISSLISCFTQLRNEFVLYGIAPLGYSFAIILSILYLYPLLGLQGLLYGVILGSIFSFLIQSISLRKAKLHELKYHFSYRHIKELVYLALPRTGTNITTQVRTIFFTGLATTFGPGGLSSYLFAQRVTDSVTQLIQQSITTASLPILSKDYLEGRNKEYKEIVKRYILVLGAIGLFASLIIFSLQDIVVSLLYGNTGSNEHIIFFLHGFLVALPFTMMSGYLSISMYAMKDTKSVFNSFFIGTILSICVGLWFRDKGEVSLIMAYVSWAISQFLLLSFFYSRKKHTR
jgi:putative peptidoglycan lipid II flippase